MKHYDCPCGEPSLLWYQKTRRPQKCPACRHVVYLPIHPYLLPLQLLALGLLVAAVVLRHPVWSTLLFCLSVAATSICAYFECLSRKFIKDPKDAKADRFAPCTVTLTGHVKRPRFYFGAAPVILLKFDAPGKETEVSPVRIEPAGTITAGPSGFNSFLYPWPIIT